MYPTLSLEKDWLLTIRMTTVRNLFQRNAPHVSRGDLVEFTSPSDPSYDCCKRVVGIEGDVVCVDPSRENDPDAVDWVKIPPGYLWVAGDNTSHSTDSRTYGPLPLGLVQGKVVARVRMPSKRHLAAALTIHPLGLCRSGQDRDGLQQPETTSLSCNEARDDAIKRVQY